MPEHTDLTPVAEMATSIAQTMSEAVSRVMADLHRRLGDPDEDPSACVQEAYTELIRVTGIVTMQAFGDASAAIMRASGRDDDAVSELMAMVTEGMITVNDDYRPR